MELPVKKGFKSPIRLKYNFLWLNIFAFLVAILSLYGFINLRYLIENRATSEVISGSISSITLLIYFAGIFVITILTMIFHELMHGMAFVFFKYKVKYGVILPWAAYAMAKEQFIKRNDYIVVGLAPLVIIDILFIALMFLNNSIISNISIVVLVINTSGAVGDLWLLIKILQTPKDTLFFDATPTENYVYIPE